MRKLPFLLATVFFAVGMGICWDNARREGKFFNIRQLLDKQLHHEHWALLAFDQALILLLLLAFTK